VFVGGDPREHCANTSPSARQPDLLSGVPTRTGGELLEQLRICPERSVRIVPEPTCGLDFRRTRSERERGKRVPRRRDAFGAARERRVTLLQVLARGSGCHRAPAGLLRARGLLARPVPGASGSEPSNGRTGPLAGGNPRLRMSEAPPEWARRSIRSRYPPAAPARGLPNFVAVTGASARHFAKRRDR